MIPWAVVALALLALAGPADSATKLGVALADPAWDGKGVPPGMQCSRYGGRNPTSPPLKVSDIPEGTVRLVVEFDDESYQPLSFDGGHGRIAMDVTDAREVVIPPVPEGGSGPLPAGVSMLAGHRAGPALPAGYLPPCSGGRGNRYSVTVRALSAARKELARGYLVLGVY